MALKIPDSMDEVVYWTNRNIDSGKVIAWARRTACPACKKGMMAKPSEKGKIKIRASYYICTECSHKIDKAEYEDTLTAEIIYTCPHCGFSGETSVPYKKKKTQGVEAVIFSCDKCKEKVLITKKMAEPKKKKEKV
ncbi:MAG: hypothetical protein HGA85_08370 [Nanoarchaeota archaeon]|nr:hypothetical protein [Nanoarchaeota archaeon]